MRELIVGEPFTILDLKGQKHPVKVIAYRATVVIATTLQHDNPISVCCMLDTGEMRAVVRDNDFRHDGNITIGMIKVIGQCILKKMLPVTSGKIFGSVHQDNVGSNKKWETLGAELDNPNDNAGPMKKWSMPLAQFMALLKAANEFKRPA